MTAVYQMEAARLSTFMTNMIDGLAGDPDAAQFLTPELRQLLMDSSWFDGRASYHMRLGAGGRLVTEMVMAVTDEAKALEMVVERGMTLPSLPPSIPPDPMTVAATLSQGSLKLRTRFPLMPFIAMGQAAAAARAQASPPARKP